VNKFFQNTRKPPKGFGGKIMLEAMNVGHSSVSMWRLERLSINRVDKAAKRVLKPGGIFFTCNEMNKSDEGEALYQSWIKMLDLKAYTQAEFKNLLSQAGFTDIRMQSKRNTRLCVSARRPHE
jgi:ubiquinone/menaquinone biosynthesis C-methylase UbiE